jgi:hypothetical protein
MAALVHGQARQSSDPEVIRHACRVASRRMVQAAFAVVMARDGVWATVLEEQAAAVGKAFPEWAEAARRAAEQGRRPVADPGVVAELLSTFGRWVEQALRAFGSGCGLSRSSSPMPSSEAGHGQLR